ncbi:NTP transferase domain-containing protein [Agromyces sp. MMS24-JH15]|uniref:nucleotidyltransferase family protein n=1 Tax=Agromyces sp. MMS24-JH15 TaxID=3243765 RepID=UPI0037488963
MTGVIRGVLLAAGAGSRLGAPKALMRNLVTGEPWIASGVRMLQDAGCHGVLVVLGAEADAAFGLVPPSAEAVVAEDWSTGLSASLRTGLRAAEAHSGDAVLVSLVDLPGLPAAVGRRVIGRVVHGPDDDLPHALARAVFGGRPGHPVLIGRAHWHAISESIAGDAGAGSWLADHDALRVECGDLADGLDIDA